MPSGATILGSASMSNGCGRASMGLEVFAWKTRRCQDSVFELADIFQFFSDAQWSMAYLPTKLGSFGGFHVGKHTIH